MSKQDKIVNLQSLRGQNMLKMKDKHQRKERNKTSFWSIPVVAETRQIKYQTQNPYFFYFFKD